MVLRPSPSLLVALAACPAAGLAAVVAAVLPGRLVSRVPLEVRRTPPLGLRIASATGRSRTVAIDS